MEEKHIGISVRIRNNPYQFEWAVIFLEGVCSSRFHHSSGASCLSHEFACSLLGHPVVFDTERRWLGNTRAGEQTLENIELLGEKCNLGL